MLRQQVNKIYNTAIYCRLSKDDGTNTESTSIGTQKEILTKYAREQGFRIQDYYIDDGVSGKDFNRPSFQRMIADIKDGKVNCVLTKDLSRLGRNYIETGMYIEMFFPENDVRYIAIADGIDTENSAQTLDIAPFKNILNDMFLKDISKKIRMARKSRTMQGKFMGRVAPYGYKKDPLDKNHLVIDEELAPIVKRIFDLSKEGYGIWRISQMFTAEKIPRPSVRDGNEHIDNSDENTRYKWTNNAVRQILRHPVYAGHIVGYRRTTTSLKNKKVYSMPQEDWVIVKNMHEPIVSDADFELVQQLMTSRKKGKPGDNGYDNIFAGLIKCADCGYAMQTVVSHRNPRPKPIDNMNYICSTYSNHGKRTCSIHTIWASTLYNEVLADIRRHAETALRDDKGLLRDISNNLNHQSKEDVKSLEKELKQANKRLLEVDKMFAKLFEDNAEDKISERNYLAMSKKYETEQAELETKIAIIREKLENGIVATENVRFWVDSIKEYATITELTAPLLHSLIEKITISEPTVIDGNKVQTIHIYYKFIGCIG